MGISNEDIDSWLRQSGRGCLAPRVLPDGAALGPFRVLGLLGRGASAEVYRARREADGAVVALKVCRLCDDASQERLRRESALLSEHPHPALPRLVASGEDDGHPWIALEELFPGDLPRAPRQVERFLLALCEALAHLHALGFVHRDVKPSNILRRAGGAPVLIDLGLVKRAEAAARGAAPPVPSAQLSIVDGRAVGHGTPGYAAPEQFSGGDLTPAADVYALGMLALRCFGGRPPRLWRTLLRRATSPLPADRQPDAAAFARALRRRRAPVLSLVAAALAALFFRVWSPSSPPSPASPPSPPAAPARPADALGMVRTLLSAAKPGKDGGSSGATVLSAAEQALPAIRAEQDPVLRADLALEFGGLFESLGRWNDAAALYDLAVDARRATDAPEPDLAEALHRRGVAYRLAGRFAEADRDLSEALALRRTLAERSPDPGTEFRLAATLSALGAARSFQNRPEDALALFRESVALRRRLAAVDSDRFGPGLARALHDLGTQLAELERFDEAIAAHDEALPAIRARAASGTQGAEEDLARALAFRADALRGAGRLDEALAGFDEAVPRLRALAAAEPTAYEASLARAIGNRALVLREIGRADEALAGLDEALVLLRARNEAEPGSCDSDIAAFLHDRALLLDGHGKPR